MTSNQHGPYVRGYTRVTMGGTEGSYPATGCQSRKPLSLAELDKLAEENGITIDYGQVYSGQGDQSILMQIGDQAISDGVDAIIPIATLAAQVMTS